VCVWCEEEGRRSEKEEKVFYCCCNSNGNIEYGGEIKKVPQQNVHGTNENVVLRLAGVCACVCVCVCVASV
jgi:hypothetical protein